MRKLLALMIFVLIANIGISQKQDTIDKTSNLVTKEKNWSLSLSTGYINIPTPYLGNNIWGSTNISYSKKNWSTTLWLGSNYWIDGRQPDLRIGISATYTIIKW